MAKIKTLIVEDMPIPLIGALAVLKNFELDVDSAENGEKALELARKTGYQIIFLDLGLPDIRGIEVAKRLRNTTTNVTSSDVVIIVLTAHAEEEYQKECEAVGVNGFLTKPLTYDNVKDILCNFAKFGAQSIQ